jgi:hypothetical protein
MNEQHITQMSQREREKALYLYSSALERGDFETVEAILQQAEIDLALEQMILELDEVLQSGFANTRQADDAVLIQRLLQQYLPTALETNDAEVELPPLLISDVLARMKTDSAFNGQLGSEIQIIAKQLPQADIPVPEHLSLQGVRHFLEQLNLSVSVRFQKLFRDTAIFLLMGRKQGMAHLAAARHQMQKRSHTKQSTSSDEEAQA